MESSCTPLAPRPQRTERRRYNVCLAHTDEEIRQCQRLRHQVFCRELGATTHHHIAGLDRDRFDPYCRHVLVRDEKTGEVVATTRLLLDHDAMDVGQFYSETEFDLTPILRLDGRIMEVGRTCIHPAYRKGSTLSVLWQGVARMIDLHGIDYLIGCASIPMHNGADYVHAIMAHLRPEHFAPSQLHVTPRNPLARTTRFIGRTGALPTLLKGYLRQGATICGEPHHDPDFQVADVFILLDRDRIARRYLRRFMQSA